MKEILILTLITFFSLMIWFFIGKSASSLESKAIVEETVGNFGENNVKIDLDYLKKIPANEQ